jgi:hypothetical protein
VSPEKVRHEVWLELISGSRVVVGFDLPDVPAANAIARRWRELAERHPDEFHEAGPGCIVRGSSIVAIKAQQQPKPSKLEGVINVPRPGVWL